ncbi:hypothetical protein BD410DRAFT_785631 [Rickenella mellea]|uniref:PWWP domain-containing protein n=1 Tax=Rickenella mellea TaxID=50990 RepID=A0A4Y7QCA4_9AGAM|nr:hypothetical protein BD410DRAFT_785631 [Rickenella mellea]
MPGDAVGLSAARRVMPRRGAASKASQNFAEQLASSSPVPPDLDDNASDSGLSTLTSLDESPSRARPSKGKAKEEEPMSDGEKDPFVTKTSAPLSVKYSLESKAKPLVSKTYGRKERAKGSASPRKASLSPTARPVIDITSSPISPLTPLPKLTRPESSPRKRTTKNSHTSTPTKRPRLSKNKDTDDELRPLSLSRPSASKRKDVVNQSASSSALPAIPSTPMKKTGSKKLSQEEPSAQKRFKMGSHVWVRIDELGQLVSRDVHIGPSYWWPAMITSDTSEASLKATLYKPPLSEHSTLTIEHPSEFNLLSQSESGSRLLFRLNTFRVDGGNLSPKKAAKSDLEVRWMEGTKLMRSQFDESEDDEFPTTLSDLFNLAPSSAVKRLNGSDISPRKRGRSRIKDTDSPSSSALRESWSPEPVDHLLDIPGELVFARDPNVKKSREHWPAIVKEYRAPTKPTEHGKYLVYFGPDEQSWITRDFFFTPEQEEFATCMMGEYLDFARLRDDDDILDVELDDKFDRRSPSPIPTIPVPVPFRTLPLRLQLAYTKPVLISILKEQYEPALDIHNEFIRGGTRRAALGKRSGACGELTTAEFGELANALCWWALRNEMFGEKMDEEEPGDDNPPSPAERNGKTSDEKVDGHFFGDPRTPPQHSSQVSETAGSSDRLQTPRVDSFAKEDSPSRRSPSPPMEEPPPSLVTTSRLSSSPSRRSGSPDVLMRFEEQCAGVRDVPLQNGETIHPSNGNFDEQSRQRGGPGYEALSRKEKIEYAMNILLPEAIIQILLWRSGERESIELLPLDEEKRLHDIGNERAHAVDHRREVYRLRQRLEKGEPGASHPSANKNQSLSTRTRTQLKK